jgi:hypothetical protein
MKTAEISSRWIPYALYSVLALILTAFHVYRVDLPNVQQQFELHSQIIAGTAQRPYNLRVLQPLIVDAVLKSAAGVSPVTPAQNNRIFVAGYACIRFLSIFLGLFFAEKIFRFFGEAVFARRAALFLAAVYPMTFFFYYYQPTSVLEFALFAVAFFIILKERSLLAVSFLLILATLNRNTSIFLVLYYALWSARDLPEWWAARKFLRVAQAFAIPAVLVGLWTVVLAVLNHFYHGTGWVGTPHDYLVYNFTGYTALKVWFFTGLLLWPAAASIVAEWHAVPSGYRALTLGWCIPYMGLHLCMAQCDEVRYWLPVYLACAPFFAVSWKRFNK